MLKAAFAAFLITVAMAASANAATVKQDLYFHLSGYIYDYNNSGCCEYISAELKGFVEYENSLGTPKARPVVGFYDGGFASLKHPSETELLFPKPIFDTLAKSLSIPSVFLTNSSSATAFFSGPMFYSVSGYDGGANAMFGLSGPVTLTPIPLPPTLLLLASAIALFGIGTVRRVSSNKTGRSTARILM